MFNKDTIKKLLNEHYPLFGLLIGVTLISVSIDPFRNGDMDWEFQAATDIFTHGIPYVKD